MIVDLKAVELWNENVRPYIIDTVLDQCKTDDILIDKLNILVDHVDQDVKRGVSFVRRFDQMNTVLNSTSYYDNSLKRAKESECDLVRELGRRIEMLVKVASKERVAPVEEVKSESVRLPNLPKDVRDLYKPMKELD